MFDLYGTGKVDENHTGIPKTVSPVCRFANDAQELHKARDTLEDQHDLALEAFPITGFPISSWRSPVWGPYRME